MKETVRQACFAGSFYPGNARQLRADVTVMLDAVAVPADTPRPQGIIAPHAGYMYSGECAATVYARVRAFASSYRTVVIVAPSHRARFDFSSVFDGSGYETPLGVVPVARELVERLRGRSGVEISGAGHVEGAMAEHSLEVQLPFLQLALGEFQLLPIVMGYQTPAITGHLVEALAEVIEPETTLLVASSDLSHFHSAGTAAKLDGRVIAAVQAFDPQALMGLIDSGKAEACGFCPITAVMMTCWKLGARTARTIEYRHSGQVTGDNEEVVGYLAAAISAP